MSVNTPVVNCAYGPGGCGEWQISVPAMGTHVDIRGWGGELREITAQCCSLVARLESLWSRFRVDSDISRLNAAYADRFSDDTWCVVDAETSMLLEDACALSRATRGAFHPLVGSAVTLWDIRARRQCIIDGNPLPPLPDDAQIDAVRRLTDVNLLKRGDMNCWGWRADADTDADAERSSDSEDNAACTIRPALDFGGIAKGKTADRLASLACALGAKGVLVSVGTSSLSMRGCKSDGAPWSVGLREVGESRSSWAGYVELERGALSTSGDYLGGIPRTIRAGVPQLMLLHHIVDPRSARPAVSDRRQVTVICESGVMAEALSTAILVGGLECVDDDAVRRWARRAGVSATWDYVILTDDDVEMSEGITWHSRSQQDG